MRTLLILLAARGGLGAVPTWRALSEWAVRVRAFDA